jgi:hypothetical protein
LNLLALGAEKGATPPESMACPGVLIDTFHSIFEVLMLPYSSLIAVFLIPSKRGKATFLWKA